MKRTRLKASKKTRSRRKAVNLLDADARAKVFERDNYRCVRCGKVTGIQWCHIFSRRHKCLRWDPDNALTMCAGCHMFWHGSPALAVPWFIKNYGERYTRILGIFNLGGKVRPEDLLKEIQ